MSVRALVIAIAVVLVLAGAGVTIAWLRPGAGGGLERSPLLAFAPSTVRAIEVTPIGESTPQRIERTDSGWRLTIDSADGSTPSWPVQSAQVRGLLAVLARATPIAAAAGRDLPIGALTLRLDLANGQRLSLRLADRAVGGRRIAQVGTEAPVYIDTPIYEALTSPGPLGWRDTSVLRTIGADTSRVTIDRPAARVALARIGARWSMREPVRAPADPEAVADLITALVSLRVTRWIDGPAPEGAFDAAMILTAERDRRSADDSGQPSVTSERESIALGGPADVGGAERFIRLGDRGAVGVVEGRDLDAVLRPPQAFLSRVPAPIQPSRIATIRIQREGGAAEPIERSLTRTLDGWRDSANDADAAQTAEELIHLLTRRPADRVSLSADESRRDEPDTADRQSLVTIIGFDGGPLVTLRLALRAGGLDARRDGALWRYDDTPAPEALVAPIKD